MTESIGFLAHIANELDAPLKSSIRRLHKLMEEYNNRDFEYISYKDFKNIFSQLELIHRQLLRCSVLSSRLLSRGKHKAMVDVYVTEVNKTIKDIVDLISRQVQNKVRFKLVLAAKLPLISVGQIEFFQIINHVLMNAVESMPAGGLVTVTSKFDVKLKQVIIKIQDQGVGMSKEFLSTVYEHRQDGLGLALVHSLIELFGGSIHFQSSLRKGTVVTIGLPIIK